MVLTREEAIKAAEDAYETMPIVGKAIKASQKWKGVLANAIDYTIWGLLRRSGSTIDLRQINTTIDCFIGHEGAPVARFIATSEFRPHSSDDGQESGFKEDYDYTGAILSILELTKSTDLLHSLQKDAHRYLDGDHLNVEASFVYNDLVDLAWVVGRPYFEMEFNLHSLGIVKKGLVLRGLKKLYGYGGDTRKLAIDALTASISHCGLFLGDHLGEPPPFADFAIEVYRAEEKWKVGGLGGNPT